MPDPASRQPIGFQQVPANATPEQIARVVNTNFQRLAPTLNQFFAGGAASASAGAGDTLNRPAPEDQSGDWVEIGRKTRTVRVFQEGNDQNYVDIKRIEEVTMRSRKTGATWKWQRKGKQAGDPGDSEGTVINQDF